MSADLSQVVRDNLEVARRVLLVFELERTLDVIPPILPKVLASSRVEKIKDASLPLVLFFVASCLEHYLREKVPNEEREKLGFEKLIERFSSRIGEKLTLSAHEIRIKRNIILHNAGVIDHQASKEFNEKGLTGYSIGTKLVLSEDEVKGYIDVCEKIYDLI